MLWARRSKDNGSAGGEYMLGQLYFNGLGVPRDVRTAVSWLERAAKQGHNRSEEELRELAVEGVPEAVAAARRLGLTP